MAEISHGGLWVRWSSLNRRDKRDFAVSMALVTLSSGMLGGLTGAGKAAAAETPVEPGVGMVAIALLPVIGLLIGGVMYFRFVARQDELFRMFHMITSLWAGGAAAIAVIVGIMLQDILGLPWISLMDILFAAAAGSVIGGFWASRRYL